MKTIVVQWVPEAAFGYGKAMRVVVSDHPRFTVGHRFDFGFMSIATDEGYTVVSIPMPPSQKAESRKPSHNKRVTALQKQRPKSPKATS
jgi:hypothetical protein